VSELFRDEKASAAEATFRAAECLERLNDARAAAFYAAVVKDFATSPFAAQARTKAAGAPTTETKTKESKP
jgi:5-formyltetrahydrofolate cyclo-ligase